MQSIIYAACFGYLFVDFLQVWAWLRLRFKPFNCGVCMSLWCAMLLTAFNGSIIDMVGSMCAAAVLNILLTKYINS